MKKRDGGTITPVEQEAVVIIDNRPIPQMYDEATIIAEPDDQAAASSLPEVPGIGTPTNLENAEYARTIKFKSPTIGHWYAASVGTNPNAYSDGTMNMNTAPAALPAATTRTNPVTAPPSNERCPNDNPLKECLRCPRGANKLFEPEYVRATYPAACDHPASLLQPALQGWNRLKGCVNHEGGLGHILATPRMAQGRSATPKQATSRL